MKIPLLPDNVVSRAMYIERQRLPESCNGDFSITGFVVDRYRHALSVLDAAGYRVEERETASEISVDSPASLPGIQSLLQAHMVRCDFTDIADTLYQA